VGWTTASSDILRGYVVWRFGDLEVWRWFTPLLSMQVVMADVTKRYLCPRVDNGQYDRENWSIATFIKGM